MKSYVQQLITHPDTKEAIWLLEHKHVYTAGMLVQVNKMSYKSGIRYEKVESIEHIDGSAVPVIYTNRGGFWTYHGPGQRIVYFLLNLKKIYKRTLDISNNIVLALNSCIVDTLAYFGITAHIQKIPSHNVGVWVGDKKIASIGLKIHHNIIYHGLAINIATDLSYFDNISPCNIPAASIMTSVAQLGFEISLVEFDRIFINKFKETFSYT